MKDLFGKFPTIDKAFGKTFGVIPNGLTGAQKAAAESIINNTIGNVHIMFEGGYLPEEALFPVVGQMQLTLNSQLAVVANAWGGKASY